ncbi:SRPBCC family protein [Streptomyces sp. NPDC051776]|uniref:SRPBCC family protein n=1 Tax=Streptomyces sp. NPDC051776 TaxID=3155414 RepID=UPI00341CF056
MNETLTTADGRPVLRIERRLGHPPEKVWRAVTEPEHLSQWYPFRATRLELRLGGKIRFDDGAGTTLDAIVTELDPQRLFAFSTRAPAEMTRESDDLIRFELRPDGTGCLLVFTHIFDDRYAAASYASGWQVCLDALEAVVDERPVEPSYPVASMHDAYVEKFGLDSGVYSDTVDGWVVRFERQLTQPADRVWALLARESGTEAGTGDPVPSAFTSDKVHAGAVTSVKEPELLEYAWESGGRTAGRVRWELKSGTGHGARLVLTQTGPGDLTAERHTALKAWKRRIARLAEDLRALPRA